MFKFGLVTYSNKSKNKILKVPNNIIKKYGAVSIQCCLSMVNNLSKIAKSNISISITGIAGPGGGSKNKPVGLVYIGLKKGFKVKTLKISSLVSPNPTIIPDLVKIFLSIFFAFFKSSKDAKYLDPGLTFK